VVVTLSGINDAPTFTTAPGRASVTETAGPTGSNALLTAQGSAGFADLDLTDAHTVAVSMQGRGFIGAMTASVVTDTTAGGAGRVVWNWSAPDKALDFLGAGQTLDQTYTLTLSDGKGGVVRQDVVVTLVGTDDLPSITGSTGATWYEGTAVNHARSGTLTFADADLTDHLTVSFAGQSVSYTSVSGADLTASLTADQVAALKAAFTMP
ncbi:VCBS domain-containing protein, partial [Methylorubrum suomiense]